MDPFVMAHLLWHLVPRSAQNAGVSLQAPVHSYFIYDRGIPLWAGNFVSWLFPRLGGTSIHRGKADRLALKAARDLFANGRFPIAVAPEGTTNDHSEIVSPLEPGVAQLGFWCVEDLLKVGRHESVLIVPIGIQYRYITPPWDALADLLTQVERTAGLSPNSSPSPGCLADARADELYGRLLYLGDYLLNLMEAFYERYYHRSFPESVTSQGTIGARSGQNESFNEQLVARLQTHLRVALQVAEEYFGLKPKGNLIDRCRRLEPAGWDRIYRQDLEQLSSLERGLADLLAEEASLRLWHMHVVERLSVITEDYILQKPTADRFAEIILILWRIVTFITDGQPNQPPDLGRRSVHMVVGEPLSVSARWSIYEADRRSARKAVMELTQDLQAALEQMIA